jgi:inorganic triphosphatase YgiF
MLNKSSTGAPTSGAAADLRVPSHLKEEAELKFIVSADAFDRVRETPVLMRHARDSGITCHLETIYYDTPDRALFSHGISLRVRRNGPKFVQTLKCSPVHGEPFVRGEWEVPVDSVAPDLSSVPKDDVGRLLDDIASHALAPVFVTKVHRRIQQLDFSGAVLEVAFDEGVIESSGRSEPLTEIEIEAKAGDPLALYDLGLELVEIAPLRIGTQSKSDRGYGLAFGLAPNSTKATPPAINAEHTVDDVIGMLLGSCQHHLLANQAVAELSADPEGVHQMRVALRRMRTISTLLQQQLDLSSPEVFNSEAKWLGKLLGAARDWDVFATTENGCSGDWQKPHADWYRPPCDGAQPPAAGCRNQRLVSAPFGRMWRIVLVMSRTERITLLATYLTYCSIVYSVSRNGHDRARRDFRPCKSQKDLKDGKG